MARKTNNAKEQATLADQEPEPTATKEKKADPDAAPKGRTPGGQFAAGNAGGPGNPHARHCAGMLQAFRDNITEDEMLQICRMLFVKAVGGDISAAKIILSYKIGKPLPAPHPDSIDRDEWDHYQNDAIRDEEMKLVLSSLPTHSGNDIARVSLPIMTAGRMNDLAAQLLDGLPPREYAERGEGGKEKGERTSTTEAPIPNGKMGREYAEKGENREEKGERTDTTEPPLANGKMEPESSIPGGGRRYAEKTEGTTRKSEGTESQQPTRRPPLANGKTEKKSSVSPTSRGHEGNKRMRKQNARMANHSP
jgi:hypothetical protein